MLSDSDDAAGNNVVILWNLGGHHICIWHRPGFFQPNSWKLRRWALTLSMSLSNGWDLRKSRIRGGGFWMGSGTGLSTWSAHDPWHGLVGLTTSGQGRPRTFITELVSPPNCPDTKQLFVKLQYWPFLDMRIEIAEKYRKQEDGWSLHLVKHGIMIWVQSFLSSHYNKVARAPVPTR